MAALRYRDEHNKVGYLQKPTGSDDYHQILDFLRASHIRSPELGPPAILATIDETSYTIIEDSVRSQLQLADDGGIDDLPIAENVFWNGYLGSIEGLPMQLFRCMLPKDEEVQTTISPASHHSLRSTQAPPVGHTLGGAEDLMTLTAVSSVVSTLVQKRVNAMEVKSRTKKRKVVVSDSDQEEGGEQDVDLDALLALANAAVIADSNIPPGGTSSSHIPTDVPTGVSPAGVSNKGKTPMVEEDITVKERTLKQMEDDRLGEEAAKRLHDKEQAQVDRQRAELKRRRQQEVLASAMYYTEADWINIMAQVKLLHIFPRTHIGAYSD
ncbi:hypothetical protein Tco_0493412 [Tanacetum coccineum]